MSDTLDCTRCPAFTEWVIAFRGAARQMPDPVTTEQPTPDGPPDELIKAATDAASREHYAGFVAAQFAVGVNDPVPYDQLSERTRRIRENQMRGLATAALAASWPLLRAQIADEIRGWRMPSPKTDHAIGWNGALEHAAERVARGGTDA